VVELVETLRWSSRFPVVELVETHNATGYTFDTEPF
jgi:hypothetical protein